MKPIIPLACAITAALMSAPSPANNRHIVLPNSQLIGCQASACTELWLDIPSEKTPIYPKNVSIDIKDRAILGMVVHYDKSVSLADLNAAINERYARWLFVDNVVKVWRVEPEQIAIQTSKDDDGTSQVIYLSAKAWENWHSSPKPRPISNPRLSKVPGSGNER